MQATINVAQNDYLNHRIALLFKPAGAQMRKLLPAFLICLVVAMGHGTSAAQTMSPPTNAPAPSDAQKTFEKMKTFAGSWQGTIMDIPINITIRLQSHRNSS